MQSPLEDRYCPICGKANGWPLGLVRHFIGEDKYVHIKFQNRRVSNQICVMASIIKNGVRYLKKVTA